MKRGMNTVLKLGGQCHVGKAGPGTAGPPRPRVALLNVVRPTPYRNEPPPGSLSLFFCAAAA